MFGKKIFLPLAHSACGLANAVCSKKNKQIIISTSLNSFTDTVEPQLSGLQLTIHSVTRDRLKNKPAKHHKTAK